MYDVWAFLQEVSRGRLHLVALRALVAMTTLLPFEWIPLLRPAKTEAVSQADCFREEFCLLVFIRDPFPVLYLSIVSTTFSLSMVYPPATGSVGFPLFPSEYAFSALLL